MIPVFVDGAAPSRGGAGGIGWTCPILGLENAMYLRRATNQQAEILAAALALHELERGSYEIVSDSRYVVDGWARLPVWAADGWRTAAGGPVANLGHWERLMTAATRHVVVRISWTKGHVGTAGNERADHLAGEAKLLDDLRPRRGEPVAGPLYLDQSATEIGAI